ncbi:MAG: hypothetical protein HYX71_01390 [Opitutae bacterium]|nr:hypothetical protein [Opitutae bacterium]
MMVILVFRRTTQISHARRAGKPSLLKYGAMLSGDIINESGEIKGVVLWLLDGPLLQSQNINRTTTAQMRTKMKKKTTASSQTLPVIGFSPSAQT